MKDEFMLNKIKNEKRRITCGCATQGCPWRVHGSPTYDRVAFMLKTLRNEHTYLAVTKNKDVRAHWLGRKFQGLIQENPEINIRVLHSVVLMTCGLDMPDHTLYRTKNFVLGIEEKKHIRSYNMLYKYGEVVHERNLGSCIKVNIININPEPKIHAHFQRLFKKRAGKPKKQRIREATESRRVQRSTGFRCSKCKEVGHNSRTCKNRDHLTQRKRTKAVSTSTTPSNINQPQKSRRMEVGNNSAGPATNNQTRPPSSQMMPPNLGTVTKALWFPNSQQQSSNQPFNPVESQPLTLNAP
ncbi:hypothetical protein ACOSQ3_007356 [Xanthoceras sorbifolium]